MSKPQPPASIAAAGQALWTSVVANYDLRADELAVLTGACRAADMIAGLEETWDGEPYTRGSMGQLVEHPAPKGIRAWQAALDQAMARLKLPDDKADGESNQNRSAAQSRWAQHGKGA